MSFQVVKGLGLLVILVVIQKTTSSCMGDCPALNCDNMEYTAMGECCPVCCVPGATFKPDVCTFCSCQDDNSIACVGTACTFPTQCSPAVMTNDQCGCPTCPDCTTVRCALPDCPPSLQFTPPGECCPTCGPINCAAVLCAIPVCPPSQRFTPPGECCPKCGPVDCATVLCALPDCPKSRQFTPPGECCPRCEAINCAAVLCAKPNCPKSQQFTPPGECCPRCKTVDCSLVKCARPSCDPPWVKEPGACCPHCPRDLVDCTKVFCIIPSCPPKRWVKKAGDCCVACHPRLKKRCPRHCPQPQCPVNTWITETGACCPRCPVTDCSSALCHKPRCSKKKWITPRGQCCPLCPGSIMHPPSANPDCSDMWCKKPDCPVDRYVVPPGECCAKCSRDPVPPLVDHDRCDSIECLAPRKCEKKGGELVTPPGECCPICIINVALNCKRPHCPKAAWRRNDLSWCAWCPPCIPGDLIDTGNPCMPAICLPSGKIITLIIDCLCLMFPGHEYCQCPGLATPEGECCPQCPEVNCLNVFCPKLPCPKETQETLEGECCPRCKKCTPGSVVPSSDPCTESCHCTEDSHVECFPILVNCYCGPLGCDCEGAYIPEGECCPRCPGCTPGEPVQSPDPCNLGCFCTDEGVVECFPLIVDCFCGFIVQCTCPGLHTPEGNCCPVCPEQDCNLLPPCAPLSCPMDDQVTEPNACCPRCIGGFDKI